MLPPFFCRSSRTWSHSWSWCFFCEHCLRRGDGSWKGQSWTIPHLLLYFSIDKMNIETSKYHNPFVVLDMELLILYWWQFEMHSCRLTFGWGTYCWNTVRIYTGWKDYFLSVECHSDLSFRFGLTNATILSCYGVIHLQLWHLPHQNQFMCI